MYAKYVSSNWLIFIYDVVRWISINIKSLTGQPELLNVKGSVLYQFQTIFAYVEDNHNNYCDITNVLEHLLVRNLSYFKFK